MFCVAGGRKCGEGYGACQGGARCHAEQGPNARGTAESYPGISSGGADPEFGSFYPLSRPFSQNLEHPGGRPPPPFEYAN